APTRRARKNFSGFSPTRWRSSSRTPGAGASPSACRRTSSSSRREPQIERPSGPRVHCGISDLLPRKAGGAPVRRPATLRNAVAEHDPREVAQPRLLDAEAPGERADVDHVRFLEREQLLHLAQVVGYADSRFCFFRLKDFP